MIFQKILTKVLYKAISNDFSFLVIIIAISSMYTVIDDMFDRLKMHTYSNILYLNKEIIIAIAFFGSILNLKSWKRDATLLPALS